MADQTSFPTLLEAFFTRRLIAQRRASSHTVASYRDTFRLLFQFAEKQLAKVLGLSGRCEGLLAHRLNAEAEVLRAQKA